MSHINDKLERSGRVPTGADMIPPPHRHESYLPLPHKKKKKGNPINNPPIYPSHPQSPSATTRLLLPYLLNKVLVLVHVQARGRHQILNSVPRSRVQGCRRKEASKQASGLWITGGRKQQVERKRIWRFTDRAGDCRRPASALIGRSTDARKRQILCL